MWFLTILSISGGKDDATENAGTAIDAQGNGIFTGTFQSFQATFGAFPNVQFLRNRAGVSVLNDFAPVSGDIFVAKVHRSHLFCTADICTDRPAEWCTVVYCGRIAIDNET